MLYGVFKSAGRTRWKCLETDDVNHARELLAEEIKSEAKVDWKRSRTVSLRQLLQRYESNPMNLADTTLKIRLMLLEVFKKTWPFSLGLRVREVKPFMLRTWIADRRSQQNLMAAGVNNYIRLLHGLFALGVELGAISENTAHTLKLLREEGPDRLTPTWEQGHEIVAAVKSRESQIAIEAMLLLGLGQAELKNLRGEHFDLTNNWIVIRRQKTQKVFKIPIYPHAQNLVKRLQTDQRIVNGQRVFPIHNPREALRLTCMRLKMPAFSPRSLRRAFIVHALERGVDPRVVASWQGHRDATLILKVYGHWVNQDHAQRMAALMN